jgi:hypothetical protein
MLSLDIDNSLARQFVNAFVKFLVPHVKSFSDFAIVALGQLIVPQGQAHSNWPKPILLDYDGHSALLQIPSSPVSWDNLACFAHI